MKKIQKNAARFDNLKQDFLDDREYSGTAEATLNGYRYDITRFLKFLSDEQLTIIGVTAHSGYTVEHNGNIFVLVPGFLCRIQKFLKLWPVQLCSGECFLIELCFGGTLQGCSALAVQCSAVWYGFCNSRKPSSFTFLLSILTFH